VGGGQDFGGLNGTPLADHENFPVICPNVVTDLQALGHGDNSRLDRLYPHVLRLMVEHGIGCVVVADNNLPLGIFSERDALRKINIEAPGLAGC
jgi:CBS domain